MGTRRVDPASLVKPKGYTHAVVGSGTPVLLAGQIGCDTEGRVEAPGDLVRQFARALDNLLEALRAAGGGPTDLAQLRVYCTDLDQYRAHLRELGEVWRERFRVHYPAMSVLGVTELFDADAMVELEGVAHVG